MFINNISILYYLLAILLGIIAGQFIDWCNIRLLNNKKLVSKEIFDYRKVMKINFKYILITIALYLIILYQNGVTIKTLSYIILTPLLLSAFSIDYKEKIIPNRLNLTIFEIGLLFTFIEGIININIAVDMLLGMCVGAGIFIIITLIGGLIAGKEAMGLGDVKLMGGLGLFFGMRTIIMISVIAFLLAAIIGVALILLKKKKGNEYIPFGPFIVGACFITMILPFDILLLALLKIFTLGTYNNSIKILQ